MIRVELGRQIDGHGVFEYSVPAFGIQGRSHQPLLDACRRIKSLGGHGPSTAGLYREGRDTPDLTCGVEWGASHTVQENDEGIRFAKYRPPARLRG